MKVFFFDSTDFNPCPYFSLLYLTLANDAFNNGYSSILCCVHTSRMDRSVLISYDFEVRFFRMPLVIFEWTALCITFVSTRASLLVVQNLHRTGPFVPLSQGKVETAHQRFLSPGCWLYPNPMALVAKEFLLLLADVRPCYCNQWYVAHWTIPFPLSDRRRCLSDYFRFSFLSSVCYLAKDLAGFNRP